MRDFIPKLIVPKTVPSKLELFAFILLTFINEQYKVLIYEF